MRDLALEMAEDANMEFNGLSLELQEFINFDKAKMQSVVAAAKRIVEDGEYDALRGLIYANKMEKLGKDLSSVLRPLAEDHVRLAKGETYKTFNVEVSQKETGVSYDFSSCGDPEYDKLVAELEATSKAVKEREAFLKTVVKPLDIVWNEAEVVTIQPPIRKAKLGLNLSIK